MGVCNLGPGDRATWPSLVTSANDPDYEEYDIDCPDCDGIGWDRDGDGCSECNRTGTIRMSNIGKPRGKRR